MKYFIATLIIILVGLYKLGSAPLPQAQVVQVQTIQQSVTGERETRAIALLNALGNTAPSFQIMDFVVQWSIAEDRGNGAIQRNNPWNTTQPGFNDTGCNMDDCVREYPTWDDGLAATVHTLRNGNYDALVAALLSNDPERAKAELFASPWASSHYGYGTLWPVPEVQQGAPVATTDIRQAVIQTALAQVGKPYVLGTAGPDTFDCSGLVQWVYKQHGIDTTRTTFTQLDALRKVEPSQVQPGDMIYFQYPWDQHTGILADVNTDGKWDMIHAAAPGLGVIITSDVFSDSFYTDAIIGYRAAI